MSGYTTPGEIMTGWEQYEKLRAETESLARQTARYVVGGATESARNLARQFHTADEARFELLMVLSDATHALCEVTINDAA